MAKDDGFMVVGGGEAWDGEGTIQGVYVHKDTNIGPHGSNMYTLRTADGDTSVWGSTVLDGKFDSIHVGDEVRIKSLGLSEKASPGKKPFKMYEVAVKPGSGPASAPATEQVQDAELDDSGEINVEDLGY